jgi:phage baseplate assembly protein V
MIRLAEECLDMSGFRIGIVAAQDATRCRVRVTFPDRDQMQSWWLLVVVPKTQNDKAYYLPDIGEQVVCLMDEYDEDGAVLGAVYSSADPAPAGLSADNLHWRAGDGAVFDYDRATHALSVNAPSGATITVAASGATITIDAGGNVSIATTRLIRLGAGSLKGVARLGDSVTCPAGIGSITSASVNVLAE